MFNIGGAELLVILLVALLVLGPNKLPQAARQVGHFIGEFRRIADGFQQELKSAMDDPLATATKKSPSKRTDREAPADGADAGADKPRSSGGPTEQPTVIDTTSTERVDDQPDAADGA